MFEFILSVIVEFAGMAAGMLLEYTTSKGWGKIKYFFCCKWTFFAAFLSYILIFPSDKGIFIGILVAAVFGISSGLCTIGLMYYAEKKRK